RQAAGAALYQRLLENLSSAYSIDAIVQYRTSASSPYKAAETAPRLFGKPLEDSYKIAAAPQNTLQDLVGHYYKPAECANAAIYLPYVADLLKSEPNLLKTGQDVVISGEKYTIQAGDTLADVAGYFTGKLPNYPFPKFAADVAGIGIFAPDQVVTLVRL